MQDFPGFWATPDAHLLRHAPDHPVLYLSPERLQATAQGFQTGFDGLVTYAVKANDRAEVLDNLVAAGIHTFDVASPVEMAAVRHVLPDATLHYNNPVRSPAEVAEGISLGVASWSIDDASELAKLSKLRRSAEIAVRFALPVQGAAYDFGSKFGVDPAHAARLLVQVADMGFEPSLCFHPGTQCLSPDPWGHYIHAAAQIVQAAGVRIKRLNVGGGFAANRCGNAPDLRAVFDTITRATRTAFPIDPPKLICEPGRAMVAEAFTLALRIKSLRANGQVMFLNDGIYGALADLRDMGLTGRLRVMAPDGTRRQGAPVPRVVFGPTCDSLDRLPDGLAVPEDAQASDYLILDGMGAYSCAMTTRFNGYGVHEVVTVRSTAGQATFKG